MFYAFSGKLSILVRLVLPFQRKFQDEGIEGIERGGQDDYSEDIRKILRFIKANEETYRCIVGGGNLTFLVGRLKSIFTKRLSESAPSYGFSKKNVRCRSAFSRVLAST